MNNATIEIPFTQHLEVQASKMSLEKIFELGFKNLGEKIDAPSKAPAKN